MKSNIIPVEPTRGSSRRRPRHRSRRRAKSTRPSLQSVTNRLEAPRDLTERVSRRPTPSCVPQRPTHMCQPEPRIYIYRGVSKVFKTSEEFVSNAIQDMMPRTPTKIRQTGFLAGFHSPSPPPPPRVAPCSTFGSNSAVSAPITTVIRTCRSPSLPATPRYCPSTPQKDLAPIHVTSNPPRTVSVSNRSVVVTIPAPRTRLPPVPRPDQVERELATVTAKLRQYEERQKYLTGIHQAELKKRITSAATAVDHGLIRATTTVELNEDYVSLHVSDTEL